MRPRGGVEERLHRTVRQEHYAITRAPGAALVVEKAAQGWAEVTCVLPEGTVCIEWSLGRDAFGFLRSSKNADGALFLLLADGSCEAHVMECKESINQDHWSKAKRQMQWTLVRLMALAGVLGVGLCRVICYTAFQNDNLKPDSTPDPGLLKLAIGEELASSEEVAEVQDVIRQQFDWEEEAIELAGFEGGVVHVKVQLDKTGRGRVALGVAA